ncbi:hypothetical protein L6R52_13370 [Myxococcota bacterium]|nr:hypothetical protein [Myxococcota bacterium]
MSNPFDEPVAAPPVASAPRGSSFFTEALLVARYELVSLFVTVRALLFVVVYGIVAGAVGAFYLWVDRETNGQLTALAAKAGALDPTQKAEIMEKLGPKVSPHLVDAILNGDLPPLVFTVLMFSTFAIPGLVLLIGYTGLADDLQSRFSRYVLQRVRRESWLAGKIAGHFVTSYASIVLVHVLLLGYASTLDGFDAGKAFGAMPGVWLALGFFVLGYVAFTSMISAVISPPFAALAVGACSLLFLWLLSLWPIGRFWMGAWHLELWARDPSAIAVYLAHALVFAALAYVGLKRRDV